jgi:uracil-DNA glycosylase
MNWNSFKDKFHLSWWESIKPFIESEACDSIYAFLKAETAKGKKIAPASINTYRAFYETPLEDLKGVIVLQDPYFTFTKDGPIADGLAMGCSITKKLQPTLRNFYSGIETELYNGLNLNYIEDYDVSYLANQGILMLNTALTVEKDIPNSHKEVWKPFTTFLFENVLAKTNVPILFLGKEALNFRPLLKTNPCFHLSHPASAAYTGGTWNTKDTFTQMSKVIWEQSNESILWLNIDSPF